MRIRHLFASLLALSLLPALAATGGQSIDARQARQQQRIEAGIASGALTRAETARLGRKSDRLAAREARMRADGRLSRAERLRLQHGLDRQSKRIKRQKHDRQRS